MSIPRNLSKFAANTTDTGASDVSDVTGTLPVANGGTGLTSPGTTGNILTSNGTAWTSAAPAPSAGTVTAVATGTIANGATVILNSDGTVSAVAGTAETAGSPTLFSNTGITGTSQSAYDSTTNKVIVAFRNAGNSNRGTVVVGTVSGTTISFGSPANFTTYDPINTAICYDAAQNKILVGYRDQTPFSQVRVGTISGTSVTFGSEVTFSTGNPTSNAINLIYHPVAQKVVMTAYDGNTGNTVVRVGTISGTSISFGTEVTLKTSGMTYVSTCYDSVNQKIVFTYSATGVGTFARVGTVSGTSISFGTELNILGSTTYATYLSCAYDSNAQKVLLAYAAPSTNFGTARVGTVSGTSISFGSDYTFDSASTAWISVAYMQSARQTFIAYRDQGNSNYGTLTTATISGTAITFSTAIVYESAAVLGNTVVYDASQDKSVVFYQDNGNSNYGTAVVYQADSTNLNEENYLGISAASYTNGQTATIQIAGSVDDAQTGLTAGQAYYVQRLGTLATTPATPAVFAGTARSATQLVIGTVASVGQLASPGTAGNVLTSNGAGWVSQAINVGSWEYINSIEVSGSPSFVDIDHTFSNDYSAYVIVGEGLSSSSSSAQLWFRVKVAGTVDTNSSYDFHMNASIASSATYQARQGNPNNAMKMVEFFSNTDASTNSNTSFALYIYRPADSSMPTGFNWNAVSSNQNGVCRIGLGSGSFRTLSAINGLRFLDLAVSATFVTGSLHLYRIKNS